MEKVEIEVYLIMVQRSGMLRSTRCLENHCTTERITILCDSVCITRIAVFMYSE